MNYIIANKSFGIKLNSNGSPTTCKKSEAQIFEYSKAKNILNQMPRTLKNLKFKMESVSEFQTPAKDNIPTLKTFLDENKKVTTNQPKKIVSNTYKIPDEIQNWLDRVSSINELVGEAKERKEILVAALSNIDKEKTNVEHEIELLTGLNACDGYKKYKELKGVLCRRRVIKDELDIVNIILSSDVKEVDTINIDKFIYNLENRTFKYRTVVNA